MWEAKRSGQMCGAGVETPDAPDCFKVSLIIRSTCWLAPLPGQGDAVVELYAKREADIEKHIDFLTRRARGNRRLFYRTYLGDAHRPKFEPITLIVANRRPVRLKCPQSPLGGVLGSARLDQYFSKQRR
ncbi:hypothetical protein CBL_10479 [Carabus blaptoides fortunei]